MTPTPGLPQRSRDYPAIIIGAFIVTVNMLGLTFIAWQCVQIARIAQELGELIVRTH